MCGRGHSRDRAGDLRTARVRRSRWLVRARRDHSTVVMGTHWDLSTAARRCGFDRVDTVTFGALDIDEFDHWVRTRIDAATINEVSPAAALFVPRHELARIAVEADGSLRQAGDLLHIWIAEQLATATGVNRIGDGLVRPAR